MEPRRPQPNPLPDSFFKRVHNSEATAPVNLHAFGDYSDITPEIVDPVIETEIKKFMIKFHTDEETFVDQNLRKNPIIWYHRTPSTSAETDAAKYAKIHQNDSGSGCTRCKMLGKIKKAKFKLRYQFMRTKLEQNASTLQSLRNFISSAETKLRSKGRSEDDLKKLRDAMGIDRTRVTNLTEINRQFFKEAENAPEK